MFSVITCILTQAKTIMRTFDGGTFYSVDVSFRLEKYLKVKIGYLNLYLSLSLFPSSLFAKEVLISLSFYQRAETFFHKQIFTIWDVLDVYLCDRFECIKYLSEILAEDFAFKILYAFSWAFVVEIVNQSRERERDKFVQSFYHCVWSTPRKLRPK